MPRVVPRERLERYRDTLWRRLPSLRVQDDGAAVSFLHDISMSLAFGGYALGVPTLWVAACGQREPVFPEHSHHDPAVGFVWAAKETLVHSGDVFYGRLFLGKPSFVARNWMATVLAAFPPRALSPAARAVVATLEQHGSLATKELNTRSGIRDRKLLTIALEETQIALKVVKLEERSDPFTYVWGTLDKLFGLEMEDSGAIPEDAARRKIVARWVRNLGAVQIHRLARILGWEPSLVDRPVRDLVESGAIVDEVILEGSNKPVLADTAFMEG